MGAAARMIEDDHRWFAPSDREAPREAFDDVTMVTEVSAADIEIVEEEDLPPVLPTPAQRSATPLPTGERRDTRFAELSTMVDEMRVVLREHNMVDQEIDSVEWALRERIAKL